MPRTSPPPPTGLVTAEDLLRPGTPYERGELWDGTWVVREPSGGSADMVAARLCALLVPHVRARRAGYVAASSQGYLVRREPDRVLSPDLAYVSRERLAAPPECGFVPCAPDFVVEVLSPEDRWEDALAKAGVWIGHGARVVWVVDPGLRRVAVLRAGEALRVAEGSHLVDASPALPEFALRAEEAFDLG